MPDSGLAPPRTGDRLTWVPYEDEFPDVVWTYTHLNEPDLTAKFEALADWGTLGDTDYATIQPCTNPDETSQDRHLVQDWDIDGRRWRFRAIFDGHGGHETVDYTLEALPTLILSHLSQYTRSNSSWAPPGISQLLSDAIVEFDENIGRAVRDMFPGNAIHELSDGEVKRIVNAPENLPWILRCMRGTTVLVALVDPDGANLWVASLGDCTAILGTREPTGTWATQTLSYNHNGQNQTEAMRVSLEHSGEEHCMEDDRVLGAIAVTRAVGDFVFKLPAIYSQRALLACDVGFRTQRKVEDLLPRVISPPYVSNLPQVQHVALPRGSTSSLPLSPSSSSASSANGSNGPSASSTIGAGPVLLMYSDGLGDLYEDEFRYSMKIPGFWSTVWGKVLGEMPNPGRSTAPGGSRERKGSAGAVPGGSEANAAMRFVRLGLGGDDVESVSRSLTSEYEWRWMDDTSVLVVRL